MLAVAQREEARLLAFEKFFDDDFRAACAERAGEAGVDGASAFVARLRDDDALAGREAVGLDDDRQALPREVGLRARRHP